MSNRSLFYDSFDITEFNDRGLSGLVNLGNTCYMNTCIQCISNIPALTNYFLSKKYSEDLNKDCIEHHVVEQWVRLLHGLWDENCTVAPQSFYKIVSLFLRKNGLSIRNGEQHDLSEFLSFFIDTMHKALKQEVDITIKGNIKNDLDKIAVDAMNVWKNYFKNDYSIFVELFYGQYINKLICPNCNYSTNIYDPFCYLLLPIDIESNISNDEIDLIECFDNFTNTEILDSDNQWKCENCNTKQNALNKYNFWKLPNILIISLKRFNKNNKINKKVNYPTNNLNLRKYTYKYENNANYNLYGVGCHIGTPNFGHYYSYILNTNKKWYKYDDNIINEIENINEIITSNAYCLFYIKNSTND